MHCTTSFSAKAKDNGGLKDECRNTRWRLSRRTLVSVGGQSQSQQQLLSRQTCRPLLTGLRTSTVAVNAAISAGKTADWRRIGNQCGQCFHTDHKFPKELQYCIPFMTSGAHLGFLSPFWEPRGAVAFLEQLSAGRLEPTVAPRPFHPTASAAGEVLGACQGRREETLD